MSSVSKPCAGEDVITVLHETINRQSCLLIVKIEAVLSEGFQVQLIFTTRNYSVLKQRHHWIFELPHDKTNKITCARLAKNQISLGIRPVWSESSLSAWRNIGPLSTRLLTAQWRLIRLGGCTNWSESSLGAHVILLVLSCDGSILFLSLLIDNKMFDTLPRAIICITIPPCCPAYFVYKTSLD